MRQHALIDNCDGFEAPVRMFADTSRGVGRRIDGGACVIQHDKRTQLAVKIVARKQIADVKPVSDDMPRTRLIDLHLFHLLHIGCEHRVPHCDLSFSATRYAEPRSPDKGASCSPSCYGAVVRSCTRDSSAMTEIVLFSPRRRKVKAIGIPTFSSTSSLCRASISRTVWSPYPMITSPSARLALWAGLPGSIATTRIPLSAWRPWNRTTRRGNSTFWPEIPRKPRRIFPSLISRPAMNFAVLMPMAKQIPWADRIMAVLTPMTSPRELMSGPPELPGFSAASV